MIESVEFNTEQKAKNCLEKLGNRGIDVFFVEYNGKRIGKYYVHYFKRR